MKEAMKKYRLRSPGPTPVPNDVLLAMSRTMKHHRTPDFGSVLENVNTLLRKVFNTRNPVITFYF